MRRTLVLASLLALIVAACGDPSEEAAVDPTTTSWVLEGGSIDGEEIPIVEGHPITLVFDEDQSAGGSSACNSYFGGYEISAGAISFSDIGMTMMACVDQEVMDSEDSYLAALARVDSFTSDGTSLVLTGEGVELRFVVDPAGS
jgi:heat shock protein HslJ